MLLKYRVNHKVSTTTVLSVGTKEKPMYGNLYQVFISTRITVKELHCITKA